MAWTQQRSAAALAAKERKRLDRAKNPPAEFIRRVPRPRSKARFYIQVRDYKLGDSMTLTLTPLPWPGRFVTGDGQELSTAQICRALKTILEHPG